MTNRAIFAIAFLGMLAVSSVIFFMSVGSHVRYLVFLLPFLVFIPALETKWTEDKRDMLFKKLAERTGMKADLRRSSPHSFVKNAYFLQSEKPEFVGSQRRLKEADAPASLIVEDLAWEGRNTDTSPTSYSLTMIWTSKPMIALPDFALVRTRFAPFLRGQRLGPWVLVAPEPERSELPRILKTALRSFTADLSIECCSGHLLVYRKNTTLGERQVLPALETTRSLASALLEAKPFGAQTP